MKALSIRQPWAQLIVEGYKDVENRNWPCKYRGVLVIHASLRFDYDGYSYLEEKGLFLHSPDWFTRGALIGAVRLIACIREHTSEWFCGPYGYVFEAAEEWPDPVPYKGKLGFFEVPKEVCLFIDL